MLKIDELKIYQDLTEEEVIEKALKKNRILPQDVLSCEIIKKSIDARDKKDVHYSYALQIEVKDERKYPKIKKCEKKDREPITVNRKSTYRPVVVGAGPAGLFCALTLVDNGINPIIVEQGECVEKRMQTVEIYQSSGKLNPLSNVQFGEGGAGTFSDGKLTTGVNSPLIRSVLQSFYQFGAPKEVTYLNKPHIGTDNLVKIISNMRHYMEEKGAEYHFNTKFESFEKEGNLFKIHCSNGLDFVTDTLVLATGHSARSVFELLINKNVEMARKNFSVGVRIEHKQKMINESQYGTFTTLKLPAADYKLVYHGEERSCYTFCMCPGGEVIASSSEEDGIVTNGMSCFNRDKENANAALLVNVLTTDFDNEDLMSGIYMQRDLEQKAYQLAGSNGYAPAQRVEDFLKGQPSTAVGHIQPTYRPGVTLTDLNQILPDFVSKTLKEAIPYFDRKIKGYNDPDAIMTGVETRTSSPLTILRNQDLESSISGIYPCGEGAGYAGGITTAAIDGIKVAIKILEKN